MSYAITSQGDTVESYVISCMVDKRTDIEELPTEEWKSGSSVICLEDSSVWMLGIDKTWKEL